MGATEDPNLQQKTFKFIAEKSRDQDVMYYFVGLEANPKTRRPLSQYFKDQYQVVRLFLTSHAILL
jgi:aminopeptidase 2